MIQKHVIYSQSGIRLAFLFKIVDKSILGMV